MYTRTDISAAVPRQRLTFAYDYRGRRIAKRVYSQTEPDVWTLTDERQFLYDGWQLIREVASAGVSETRTYVWGLDLSQSLQGAGGVGGLLAIIDQGAGEAGIRIPAYDANGNITELTRLTDAAIEAVYEYDPFGNTLRQTGPYASANPYRFSTKFTDDETGLVYYGYRYYSPQLGRWLSRDPIGEKGGLHQYGYLNNSPITANDLLGLLSLLDTCADWLQRYLIKKAKVLPVKKLIGFPPVMEVSPIRYSFRGQCVRRSENNFCYDDCGPCGFILCVYECEWYVEPHPADPSTWGWPKHSHSSFEHVDRACPDGVGWYDATSECERRAVLHKDTQGNLYDP